MRIRYDLDALSDDAVGQLAVFIGVAGRMHNLPELLQLGAWLFVESRRRMGADVEVPAEFALDVAGPAYRAIRQELAILAISFRGSAEWARREAPSKVEMAVDGTRFLDDVVAQLDAAPIQKIDPWVS